MCDDTFSLDADGRGGDANWVTEGTLVKRTSDGQLGRLVMSAEGMMVRLDRGVMGGSFEVPYKPSENKWSEVNPEEVYRLTPMQIARVAYEADRALRAARGEYGVKEWMSVKEQDRLKFCQEGPTDPARRQLYDAIIGVLGE